MKLRSFIVLSLVLLFGVVSTASAQSAADCGQLSRNLSAGMSGDDILLLQILLNKNPSTKIGTTGLGSPGSESTYFGSKTKNAVARFQELYKGEVLTPAGLSVGTGFVGSLTRVKLQTLCLAAISKPVVVTPITPKSIATTTLSTATTTTLLPISGSFDSQSSTTLPYIMWPASYSVHQGDKVTIFGGGFTRTNNTVMIGTQTWSGVQPLDDGSIEVTLASDAPKGKFDLTFSNSKGVSNKSFIIITDKTALAPKITSFTPTSGFMGTVVTVTGEHFSKEWNDVVVGAKKITGLISPDEKTLSFTASLPIPGVAVGQDIPNVDVAAPLWFYIVNPNGISDAGIFTLKI